MNLNNLEIFKKILCNYNIVTCKIKDQNFYFGKNYKFDKIYMRDLNLTKFNMDILFENNNILYECKIKYVRNINAYDEFIMSEVQDIMSYSVSDFINKNKLII